jgi:hypothetical protein
MVACFSALLFSAGFPRYQRRGALATLALHALTFLAVIPLCFHLAREQFPGSDREAPAAAPPPAREEIGVFQPVAPGLHRLYTTRTPPRGFVVDTSTAEVRVYNFEAAPGADDFGGSDPVVAERLHLPLWWEGALAGPNRYTPRLRGAWAGGVFAWICGAALWFPLGALAFTTHLNRRRFGNTVRLSFCFAGIVAANVAWFESGVDEVMRPVSEALLGLFPVALNPAATAGAAPFLCLAAVNALFGAAILFVGLVTPKVTMGDEV